MHQTQVKKYLCVWTQMWQIISQHSHRTIKHKSQACHNRKAKVSVNSFLDTYINNTRNLVLQNKFSESQI